MADDKVTEKVYSQKMLKETAKALGLKGYSTAKKGELLEMLKNHHDKISGKVTETPAPVAAPAPAPTPVPASEPVVPKAKSTRKPKTPPTDDVVPATDVPAKPPKRVVNRQKSLWDTFLSDYCKEHGCAMREAMQQKDAYAAYKTKHAKPVDSLASKVEIKG